MPDLSHEEAMIEPVTIGNATLINADVLTGLRSLPDESVHCVVTSPPYWGLRDYGTATWEGGNPECDHSEKNNANKGNQTTHPGRFPVCPKCGAVRVDHGIGLEPTFQEYLTKMVAVCEEIRRVLRKDGTFWMNMGDAYAGSPGVGREGNGTFTGGNPHHSGSSMRKGDGFKPKDLLLMPARLAIALQEAGWWVRSEIIWAKPNPMPESVTDRPTSSHEKIYLLTRSARYYYDADAVREISQDFGKTAKYGEYGNTNNYKSIGHNDVKPQNLHEYRISEAGRNLRNVWTMATQPYPEAHFAAYPEELPRKCIMAGTSERGVCERCGSPWVRVTEKSESPHDGETECLAPSGSQSSRLALARQAARERGGEYESKTKTVGFRPGCTCNAPTVPATVLDPFSGSATTGLAALKLDRRYIGIELSKEYIQLSIKRIEMEARQGKLFQK